jgi:N-acetylmuramoyl-L-alanine amidase
MKIQIDAGHGPNTPGKRSPDDSLREYQFNSATARYVAAILKEDYEGVEVRTDTFNDGEDVPINERYKKANAWPADVFVSIHANANGSGAWDSARGVETLVDYRKPAQAVALARMVQEKLVRATGLLDRGLQYRDNVGVLNFSKMTAILVECGFMTNKDEAALLKSDSYRQKCAAAVVAGLVEFYGLKKKATATTHPLNKADANAIIDKLGAAYGATTNKEHRAALHSVADDVRRLAGIPVQ